MTTQLIQNIVDVESIYNQLLNLYRDYSLIHRRVVSYNKYSNCNTPAKADDDLIRESLVEHVGVLPLVASFLFTHLENKHNINLGKVLIMLSVHDIGEVVVGDKHPHKKNEYDILLERDSAIIKLNGFYHSYYYEFEAQETIEAKFARAADVFSTFLADFLLPANLVKERLEIHNFSVELFEEKRREVFAWDSFLNSIFDHILLKYKILTRHGL